MCTFVRVLKRAPGQHKYTPRAHRHVRTAHGMGCTRLLRSISRLACCTARRSPVPTNAAQAHTRTRRRAHAQARPRARTYMHTVAVR
eukprot:7655960-Alexandrium_andersonii.AAC.1